MSNETPNPEEQPRSWRRKLAPGEGEYGHVRLMHNKTSVMVTIPKVWVRVLGWRAGDEVRQDIKDGTVVITNITAARRAEKARLAAEESHDAPAQP